MINLDIAKPLLIPHTVQPAHEDLKLRFSWDRDPFDERLRAKMVVTVTNTSACPFKGSIIIHALDHEDATVDDAIIRFHRQGIGGEGVSTFYRVRITEPERVVAVSSVIVGNFEEPPKAVNLPVRAIQYEQVGCVPSSNQVAVFVYTNEKNESGLHKIIADYKSQYEAMAGLQIYFFDDRFDAATKLPISFEARKCQFALYRLNRKIDYEDLIMN